MSELNLKVGDCIHYGAHGVCRVCGRENKKLGRESRDYFLLRPTGEENILLYLPVDALPEKVKLRRIMSAQEIYDLVEREQGREESWISDSKLRREICNKTLRNGDIGELIRLIKTMHDHEASLPTGKALPMSDLELMRSAEKQLFNEFQFVLEIGKEQVLPFIMGQCQVSERKTAAS